jgi:hypothetical protein
MGDRRFTKRLVSIIDNLARRPVGSLPLAQGCWSALKGTYRFLANKRVKPARIRNQHVRQIRQRALAAGRVLAIQDTTELDFTSHKKMSGRGPIGSAHADNCHQWGFELHTSLAATADGVTLGVLDHRMWARDPKTLGKSQQWRQRDLQDKESYKWRRALRITQRRLPPEVDVLMIGDSEADMYPLLATPRRAGCDVLVRSVHDRRASETEEAQKGLISHALQRAPIAGYYEVPVRRPQEAIPVRVACVAVRYTSVVLHPPAYYAKGTYPPIHIQVVEAQEVEAPPGCEPLHWVLLTSLPVESLADAMECVRLYSLRWLIERYHFILKSGYGIERLQLSCQERLQRAMVVYSVVAWRVLALTYQARVEPEAPCSLVLETEQWQALYCRVHRTQIPPQEPPTLQEAVLWIAKLGGFLGRKGDGQPGVKTLWRGMLLLDEVVQTYRIFHPT